MKFGDNNHATAVDHQSSAILASPIYLHGVGSASTTKSLDFNTLKRSRSPPIPVSGVPFSIPPLMEADSEREMRAKAMRLARFGGNLNQPLKNAHDHDQNRSLGAIPRFGQSNTNRAVAYSTVGTFGLQGRVIVHDQEEDESSAAIVGLCQDMCPESERDERERKGDLDYYERLNGDRNKTHTSLAVKKYNRTAERTSLLIRPMPVLRKTMDHLLHLLDQPYDAKFLGIYNFLWDRMRAVRMDLRMQHIFNQDAIVMLEQMIRLHIIAMHELCENAKSEGFSEGFDAHLNIEQMNKASVDLFQMYDEHRKQGLLVRTENEFRGYYALLKLDRHPGYKVEPAELSLDLAKMTPDMRCTPEISFARAVARACRTGNFVAFFRLAREATYLQACLMHSHFSKLRTNALASLHSSLQNNQGIPITQVSRWLGMEREDIESLLVYHGFFIKIFEEAYMVKVGPFFSNEADYVAKGSELVHSKRSRRIIEDVSLTWLASGNRSFDATNEVLSSSKRDKAFHRITEPLILSDLRTIFDHGQEIVRSPGSAKKKMAYEDIVSPLKNQSMLDFEDTEMSDVEIVLAPKQDGQVQLPLVEASASLIHSNIVHPFDNKHQNSTLSATKTSSSVCQAIADDQVTEFDVPKSTCEKTNKGIIIQMSTTGTSYITLKSSPYQKEMPGQGPAAEALSVVGERSTYARQMLRRMIRTWKYKATRKRVIRERQELSRRALDLLSLGPPIQHYEIEPGVLEENVSLDVVIKERNRKRTQSWSNLNVSSLICSTLKKRNPKAKCLCWKLVLCINEDDKNSYSSLTSSWLLSKLMGSRNSNEDLVVVSPSLCMWKSLVYDSDGSPSFCLSIVREVLLGDHSRVTFNDCMVGTNAIIYVISENIPWETQRINVNYLLKLIPAQSRIPILILRGSACTENSDSIISKLGLGAIDNTKVSGISVISVAETIQDSHAVGFFSHEHLLEGLDWLAYHTPVQPTIHLAQTRELVIHYLSLSVDALSSMGSSELDPTRCITIFNEALDQSVEQIQGAADINPCFWPCPEIDLFDKRSAYLPDSGWSLPGKTGPIINALLSCKLPQFPFDLSFLSQGSYKGNDLQLQKARLEECLVSYFTQATGMTGDPVRKEAYLMLQNGSSLELRGCNCYIIPKWLVIFQRIYNWQLMKLKPRELASAYVVDDSVSSYSSNLPLILQSSFPRLDSSRLGHSTQLMGPTLDEMIEVCHSISNLETASCATVAEKELESAQAVAFSDSSTSHAADLRFGRSSEAEATHLKMNQHQVAAMIPANVVSGPGKLVMLLEKCKLLQDRIGQKLALYF